MLVWASNLKRKTPRADFGNGFNVQLPLNSYKFQPPASCLNTHKNSSTALLSTLDSKPFTPPLNQTTKLIPHTALPDIYCSLPRRRDRTVHHHNKIHGAGKVCAWCSRLLRYGIRVRARRIAILISLAAVKSHVT